MNEEQKQGISKKSLSRTFQAIGTFFMIIGVILKTSHSLSSLRNSIICFAIGFVFFVLSLIFHIQGRKK